MQRVFVIHHMKRSGGHAVINWLVENTPRAKFINNEIPIQPILAGYQSVPDDPLPYANWITRKRRSSELTDEIEEASTIFVSLEDHELRVRPFDLPTAKIILILRRPENLFASRIRKASYTRLLAYNLDDRELLARAVRVWKEHARVALSSVDRGEPLAVIFYDAWLTSSGYRGRLARHFGLVVLRNPSERVAAEGGGSSFGQVDVNPVDLVRRAGFLNAVEKEVLRPSHQIPKSKN